MTKKERGYCIGFMQGNQAKQCKKHEATNPEKGAPCKIADKNSICGWMVSGKEGAEL